MIGSILGDYLGSIFEAIPNHNLRIEKHITDDSWLTFAQLEWLNSIDLVKFKHLHKLNIAHPNKDYNILLIDLNLSAKKFIVKWFDIGNKYSHTSHISGFSPGMISWVEQQKQPNNKTHIKRKTTTNGCIMRNSAINIFFKNQSLSLEEAIALTTLFCSTTHDSNIAIQTVHQHTNLIYDSIYYDLNTFKEKIKSICDIQPLQYWQTLKLKEKFIWDAERSLDISLSSVYYSSNYWEFINFCNETKMDTDTYCSIGGTIALNLYKDQDILTKEFLSHLNSFKEVSILLKKINIF